MWSDTSVIYQIYPLGAFGAPFVNDGKKEHRLLKIENYLDQLVELGIDCVLLNPLFLSSTHGYDTIDYKMVDNRLGDNDDLKRVINLLHDHHIRVIFDAVFNHCSRDFFAFKEVRKNKESNYRYWFNIDLNGNNQYNDGFSYECWEGNTDLVKFNLDNWDVRHYLLDIVDYWMDEFKVDGLRLDVAYCLNREFLKWLHGRVKYRDPDFFLLGETLHGDYNLIMNEEMLDSVTNYEAYKGLYSSFNTGNFFEILYSFNRQFGKDPWCLYTGKHLVNFVDNHDVDRIASKLEDQKHLPLIYTMLFTMPGIPCIYYGSEWGIEGKKNYNDTSLRPNIEELKSSELTVLIQKLIKIKHQYSCLSYGDYTQIYLNNKQCVYQRKDNKDTLLIAINMENKEAKIDLKGNYLDLLTNQNIEINGILEPYAYKILKLK